MRAGSFAGLGKTEIAKRRAYSEAAAEDDDLAWSVRREFSLREVGWQQFQANKYRQLQDDIVAKYNASLPLFFATAKLNDTQLEPAVVDLTNPLRIQMQTYQAFMNTSVMSKYTDTDYQPGLTVRGNVCTQQATRCQSLENKVNASGPDTIQISVNDQAQSKFENVLDLGIFTTGPALALTATSSIPS